MQRNVERVSIAARGSARLAMRQLPVDEMVEELCEHSHHLPNFRSMVSCSLCLIAGSARKKLRPSPAGRVTW